ncbi:MAG: hypothetical protein Q4D38_13775, partial [Planctomycetia bacterium]|nr:hypothetical protein [Planctomycetia bacterium]
KFPFCATLCESWCVAPTANGTGNFNAKYYKFPFCAMFCSSRMRKLQRRTESKSSARSTKKAV